MDPPLFADINKVIARLVLGYLDKENLEKVYKAFIKASQHLQEEYEGYKKDYKFVDISVGLRSIISDYYEAQQAIDEFAKSCPRSSLAAKSLMVNDLKRKVDIILREAKRAQSLAKPLAPVEKERKRKHSSDDYETSTPEHPTKRKKRKSYCITPFNLSPIDGEAEKVPEKPVDSSSTTTTDSSDVSPSKETTSESQRSNATLTSRSEEQNKTLNSKTEGSLPLKGTFVDLVKDNFRDLCLKDSDIPQMFAENINKIINESRNEPGTSAQADAADTFHAALVEDVLADILNLTAKNPVVDNYIQEATERAMKEEFIDFHSELSSFNQVDPQLAIPQLPKVNQEEEQVPLDTPVVNIQPTSTIQDLITSTTQSNDEVPQNVVEDVPIKQRLRCRKPAKPPPKKRIPRKPAPDNKINIISDVPYTGDIPPSVNPFIAPEPENTSFETVTTDHTEYSGDNILINGQQYTLVYTESVLNIQSDIQPFQPLDLKSPFKNGTTLTLIEPSQLYTFDTNLNCEIVQRSGEPENQQNVVEMVKDQSKMTPNIPKLSSYLESKCKSTPRRKASHVRILNFNNTPSRFRGSAKKRMSTVQEFNTPKSGIRIQTPNSAPPSLNFRNVTAVNLQKKMQESEEVKVKLETIIDNNEESNSTSISDTPKVSKNPRKCVRQITKTTEEVTHESEETKTQISIEDWNKMRLMANSANFDQHIRSMNREVLDKEHPKRRRRANNKAGAKTAAKMKKTPKKSTKQADKKDSSATTNESAKEGTETFESEDDMPIKIRISSPRKAGKGSETKKKIRNDNESDEILKTAQNSKQRTRSRSREDKNEADTSSNSIKGKLVTEDPVQVDLISDNQVPDSTLENESAEDKEKLEVSGKSEHSNSENPGKSENMEIEESPNSEKPRKIEKSGKLTMVTSRQVAKAGKSAKIKPEQQSEDAEKPEQSDCIPSSSKDAKEVKLTTSTETIKSHSVPEDKENSRSDSVTEVATTLTELGTKILEKSQTATVTQSFNMASLLDTPFKPNAEQIFPNTPRFLAPGTHQTPLIKFVKTNSSSSLIKGGDIPTPLFPITPGINVTPAKSDASPQNGSEGYNRKTDYSSCPSSYYKPDESEDIRNLDFMPEREAENQNVAQIPTEIVEYRDNSRLDDSDSSVSSSSDSDYSDSSSSSSSSTSCTTSAATTPAKTPHKTPSKTPRKTPRKSIEKSGRKTPGRTPGKSSAMFSRKTPGKTPFKTPFKTPAKRSSFSTPSTSEPLLTPARLGLELSPSPMKESELKITPGKQSIQDILHSSAKKNIHTVDLYARPKNPLEEKRLRMLEFLKKAENAEKLQSSAKKPVKNVKKPAPPPKQPEEKPYTFKKDLILQRNQDVQERSKPVPTILKSKRKNPTPRKIVMLTSPTNHDKKKVVRKPVKSPAKSVKKPAVKELPPPPLDDSDNAVNMSLVEDDKMEEETIENIAKHIESTAGSAESSNTFQNSLINQGFDKKTASLLEQTLVKDLERNAEKSEINSKLFGKFGHSSKILEKSGSTSKVQEILESKSKNLDNSKKSDKATVKQPKSSESPKKSRKTLGNSKETPEESSKRLEEALRSLEKSEERLGDPGNSPALKSSNSEILDNSLNKTETEEACKYLEKCLDSSVISEVTPKALEKSYSRFELSCGRLDLSEISIDNSPKTSDSSGNLDQKSVEKSNESSEDESGSEEEEVELTMVSLSMRKTPKNYFHIESETKKSAKNKNLVPLGKNPPCTYMIDGRKIVLEDSETYEIFSMEPIENTKKSQKQPKKSSYTKKVTAKDTKKKPQAKRVNKSPAKTSPASDVKCKINLHHKVRPEEKIYNSAKADRVTKANDLEMSINKDTSNKQLPTSSTPSRMPLKIDLKTKSPRKDSTSEAKLTTPVDINMDINEVLSKLHGN